MECSRGSIRVRSQFSNQDSTRVRGPITVSLPAAGLADGGATERPILAPLQSILAILFEINGERAIPVELPRRLALKLRRPESALVATMHLELQKQREEGSSFEPQRAQRQRWGSCFEPQRGQRQWWLVGLRLRKYRGGGLEQWRYSNQKQSEAIRSNQQQSEAIRGLEQWRYSGGGCTSPPGCAKE